MPSNTELNAGSGGHVITTKQRSHDGDTTRQQVVSVAGVTGTEDAYTHTDIQAGGGTEANALRVTIANDSTGVVSVDDGGTTISVDDGAGSLTVDGTVTANAGTGTFTVDGSGVTQPVSGTVTANLGATDNAVLDAIDSNTDYGAVTGGGAELGALRVTIANDSTGVVSVDDNGGSLTVDGTVTANAGTGTFTVDGSGVTQPVSGTVTANAGTGTFTVDLGANNDVTIDGSSVVGTTDAVAPASPTGIPFLMERDDALSALTPVEGDWVQPRCDANGALWVNASNAGGTATDDAAFAVASDTVAVMGALADETTPDSVDEGDVGAVRMTLNRHLKVQPNDFLTPAGDSMVDDTNDALQVNVVAGSAGGTEYTEDAAAAANPAGGAQILVRQDTPAALTSLDGDNVARRGTNYGAAYTQIVDSSGNFIDTFGGSGGTASTDDGAFVVGTGQGTPIMGLADETTPDSVDEGDVGVVRMTLARELKVQPNDFLTPAGDSMVDDTNDALQVNVVAGSAGGTEYSEDAATPATIAGGASMMERDDALTTLTPIEGDWAAQRCTAEGALWVQDFNSDAILADTANMDTNLGTIAGAVTGTEMQVDVVAALPAGDNNIGNVDIASSVALDVSAATVTVDSELPAAAALADNAANPTAPAVGSFNMLWDGVTWDRAPGNATDGLKVNLGADNDVTVTGTVDLGATDNAVLDQIELNTSYGDNTGNGTAAGALRVTVASDTTGVLSVDDNGGSITVDNGGTFATQVDGAALTALQLIDNPIVAHDAVATGSTGVNMAGARATNSVEGITQVANADATRLQADLNGVLLSRPHSTLEELVSERDSITTATSTAFATDFAAPGAGNHLYVTAISVVNTSANDTYIDFQNGASGAVIWTMALPANGGANMSFTTPLKVADNTALAYQVGTASTTVYVSVTGFTAQG